MLNWPPSLVHMVWQHPRGLTLVMELIGWAWKRSGLVGLVWESQGPITVDWELIIVVINHTKEPGKNNLEKHSNTQNEE